MRKIDLVGHHFGKLKVLEEVGKNASGNYKFLCQCDCGNTKVIPSDRLRNSKQISCGCIQKTHGFSIGQNLRDKPIELKFYHRFQTIKQRCVNPNNPSYKNYGGRGIKFLWGSFEEFKNDMFNSFLKHERRHGLKNTQIDRINNDGDYCKENCRWTTCKEQRRNSRQNKFVNFQGKDMPLIEVSERTGVKYRLLIKRINAGVPLEEALVRPNRRHNFSIHN